jgi:hypothetical protein
MTMSGTTASTRRLVGAAIVVASVGLAVVVPTIAGIATWKWMLGLVGLLLWILARVDATLHGHGE